MEERDKLQDLMAGYALDSLDEAERAEAEQLIKTNPQARKWLDEFQFVTNGLALSVKPVELPAGSLNRLRQKAGIASPASNIVDFKPRPAAATRPRPVRSFGLAWAAALVLFITSAVFGTLWVNTTQDLTQAQTNNRNLASLLVSPSLKVSDLQSTGPVTGGSWRVYSDPSNPKAYLVAQNMATLPADKEYEAWFITADSRADKAGLLGTGATVGPTVFALNSGTAVNQYNRVAITIEKKGGVDKTDQKPILLGNLSA